MTPTAIRDTVGCNCSCSACVREREKESVSVDGERGKRDRKRDISGGRVGEKARKRGHSERVRALHLIPLSDECASLGYFRDIGPESVYIYMLYSHTWIPCICIYRYIYRSCTDTYEVNRYGRKCVCANHTYAVKRRVHTREIVRTSVIDLFREEVGISGLRERSEREIKENV